jgi:hypothetical protein
MRYVNQFFRFLYDFLVGDAWELFVGPIVGLVVVWLLVQLGAPAAVTGVALFVVVVVVGVTHLALALRGSA